jgi:hypothetical protein
MDFLFDGSSNGFVSLEPDISLLLSVLGIGLAPLLSTSCGLSPFSEFILLLGRELLVLGVRVVAQVNTCVGRQEIKRKLNIMDSE